MALSLQNIRNNAHQFSLDYAEAVKENAESQSFLNDFFAIFGVSRRRVASFELPVKIDETSGTKRIDLFWPGVLLVEMKSTGQNLDKAYHQGLNYFKGLKDQDLPRYVLTCDLDTFRLYDLDDQKDYTFQLADLVDNLHLFDFMVGQKVQEISEVELNLQAADLLGDLHDALDQSGFSGHELQVFMVRVLFCLFAEDTGVFNRHQFTQYLLQFTDESGFDTEMHLHKLFQILDKPPENRNKNLIPELQAFPYVNGHLFKERIDMPSFSADMREQLIECCLFNWKDISPAIFGSLFQSIMDKTARRNLGAHYTSEENILKTIEPLFLNALKTEFNAALKVKSDKSRNSKLQALTDKIRHLTFMDPACGCGNFLIITYRELRRLELEILQAQHAEDAQFQVGLEIEPAIPLNNFYGIEIDEWPARIAEVAMWLTQHQMNVEFAKRFGHEPDLLPLKEHAQIHHTNALERDWNDVIDAENLNYLIGNPPFVGSKYQTPTQRELQSQIFGKIKNAKQLDFVSNWFYKAAQFVQTSTTHCALVSTNSITMGEQVATLWQPILDLGIKIDFAHRTFQWNNEASGKAAVHCVIIGFSGQQATKPENKVLFDYPDIKGAPVEIQISNINPYLIDAANIVIANRSKPLGDVPKMSKGNMPLDGGNLLMNEPEFRELVSKYPQLTKWIKQIVGGREFINNIKRYCLWLPDATTKELRELNLLPEINSRFEGVKQMRLASPDKGTQEKSSTPWLFRESHRYNSLIAIPEVSSERRLYIPMAFMDNSIIPSNKVQMVPNATLFEFGILNSEMHMDWVRTVTGRLKSDYQYSAKLVYNNFPWPQTDDQQKAQIEKLAQQILDAREAEFAKDRETSLADLYDPNLMPPSLRKAHQALDKAVDKLYHPEGKTFKTPLERVNHLFALYNQLTKEK
jgi:hypothetical protein